MSAIDNLIDQLTLNEAGDAAEEKEVSYVGQGLSLDTEEDAAEIVQAIQDCPGMTTLRLEGNTFGTPAAKAIAKALESQPAFTKALWKDMFTRRSKDEIPKALSFLSSGIMLANAQLVILDLSDNAFGPRGLVGIQDLLQSKSCFTLQELHLNNNGLGISGATMLSEAMCNCVDNSIKAGTPLKLKIFVCGRNRLENEGAIAVSKFLKKLNTLESVAMPQNGIYAPGVERLADAFSCNPNLGVINLNDNTVTEKGATFIGECLPALKQLKLLNLGDCLLRTGGALTLAKALNNNCADLMELNLGYNEIDVAGGLAIIRAVENKQHLHTLTLNGNQFGEEGCQRIEEEIAAMEKSDVLGSLSEDEGDDDEDDGDDEDEDYDEDEGREGEDDDDEETEDSDDNHSVEDKTDNQKSFQSPMMKSTTPAEFVSNPTQEGLISLSENNENLTDTLQPEPCAADYLNLYLKVSSVVDPDNLEAKTAACKYADELVSKAIKASYNITEFNNIFLVYVGLLKDEGKSIKKNTDITGVLTVLEHVVRQSYFPSSTRDLLQFFLSRPLVHSQCSDKVKHTLMQTLYRI